MDWLQPGMACLPPGEPGGKGVDPVGYWDLEVPIFFLYGGDQTL